MDLLQFTRLIVYLRHSIMTTGATKENGHASQPRHPAANWRHLDRWTRKYRLKPAKWAHFQLKAPGNADIFAKLSRTGVRFSNTKPFKSPFGAVPVSRAAKAFCRYSRA